MTGCTGNISHVAKIKPFEMTLVPVEVPCEHGPIDVTHTIGGRDHHPHCLVDGACYDAGDTNKHFY